MDLVVKKFFVVRFVVGWGGSGFVRVVCGWNGEVICCNFFLEFVCFVGCLMLFSFLEFCCELLSFGCLFLVGFYEWWLLDCVCEMLLLLFFFLKLKWICGFFGVLVNFYLESSFSVSVCVCVCVGCLCRVLGFY